MVKASLAELARLLGRDALIEGEAAARRYARDFAGHDLGRPIGAALPRTTAEAAAVVAWARRRKAPLTPVGALTSFWASTRVEGRLVVDLRRMDKVLSVDAVNGTVAAQAGMSVGALDAELAARGLFTPVCPDGFGDATLGSMIANDTSAGHGMFDGSIGDQLVCVTAVLGSGVVARTGASSLFAGVPAFTRSGLPDPTGLLLASEGALGLVTEIVLRARPAPARAAFSIRAPGEALLAAARRLRYGGLCHSLRQDFLAVRGEEQALLEVAAYSGADELRAKTSLVTSLLEPLGLSLAPVPPPPRWTARPPVEGWKGVALAIPYSNVEAVLRLWRERLRARVAGAASPDGFLRVYYGSAAAAALVGWSHGLDASQGLHEDLACEIRALLLPFGVPYRIGTVWRTLAAGRVDPAYRALMAEIKNVCDPDGILNPGVSLFAAGKRTGPRRRPDPKKR